MPECPEEYYECLTEEEYDEINGTINRDLDSVINGLIDWYILSSTNIIQFKGGSSYSKSALIITK